MPDIERTKRTITQSVVKATQDRLQDYIDLENQPKKDQGLLLVARTVAVNACRDLADFLSGEIVMISRADAEDAIRMEDEVPQLRSEIDDLRKLVPKTKLKAHDNRKLLKEGKN